MPSIVAINFLCSLALATYLPVIISKITREIRWVLKHEAAISMDRPGRPVAKIAKIGVTKFEADHKNVSETIYAFIIGLIWNCCSLFPEKISRSIKISQQKNCIIY